MAGAVHVKGNEVLAVMLGFWLPEQRHSSGKLCATTSSTINCWQCVAFVPPT